MSRSPLQYALWYIVPRYSSTTLLRLTTDPLSTFHVPSTTTPIFNAAILVQWALIHYDAELGALTQLWAGTSPEGAHLNGKVCFCRLHLSTHYLKSDFVLS